MMGTSECRACRPHIEATVCEHVCGQRRPEAAPHTDLLLTLANGLLELVRTVLDRVVAGRTRRWLRALHWRGGNVLQHCALAADGRGWIHHGLVQ